MAAVLLQTDLVDSTAVAQRLGDAAAATLWQRHDSLARALLRDWRGREIDKSDGFLLLFADVADAVGYALAYQRALRGLEPPLSARAGLHCGPLSLRETPADDVAFGAKPLEVDGLAKPVTARIMVLAMGGQTLISAEACAELGALEAARWRVQSHGHWRLKGVDEPLELFELGEAGIAPFAPPPDAPKAWRVVWRDDTWLPVAELRHNLPAERDSFVGRGAALQELARRFDDDGARLVSLLGIGGTGKTRLALRYARGWLGNFPGGAWFCDLSQARTLDGIVHAVAQGLDVPLGKADPVQQLGAAIAGRGRSLLILDNFEQVAKHAEATLGQWLDRAAEAHFLVTTREVLGIVGERTMALDPLPSAEAVTLFEQRAAACEGYRPTEDDRQALPALVALMDGLPLAIELAAPRVRVMPPRVLLQRMSERFKVLASTGGRRDRQATLRATLDWSWELLSDAERSTLAQLSVFHGGFTLAAAEAVIDLSGFDTAMWIGELLQQLIEKSLVQARGDRRFDLLLSVQAYAAQKLVEADAAQGESAQVATWRRHWTHFGQLDELAATTDRCAEIENLVSACHRAASLRAPQAAVDTLALAWAALKLCGPFTAALQLVDRVGAMHGLTERQRASIEWVAGNAYYRLGRAGDATVHGQRGLALAIQAQDARLQVRLHCTIADVFTHGADPAGARRHLELARQLAVRLADDQLTYTVLNGLGTLAFAGSHLDEAQVAFEEALEISRRLRHRRWEGGLLGNLGIVAYSQGRIDEAAALYRGALEAAEEVGDRQWAANTRCNFGLMLCEQGDLDSALAESAKALSIARDLGSNRLESAVLCNIGLVHKARADHVRALSHFEAAALIAVRMGDIKLEAQIRRQLGHALTMQGRADRALAELDRARELAMQFQDDIEVALVRCETARALLQQGSREAAQRELASVSATLDKTVDASARAQIETALGDLEPIALPPC